MNVAQTALSTQIQNLEAELGFKLFDRLPRGVKLSVAGKLFLEDAKLILQQVAEAGARAARVARGHAGTLRVGFTENASWHGVAPDSVRRFRELHPDVELQLSLTGSLEQIESIRSGRLDASFVYNMLKSDGELDQLPVAIHRVELAVSSEHPLAKKKKLRLRELVDASFIWFPRKESPILFDHLMRECFRGGLTSPRLVQEAVTEGTLLSLVSQGMGVGWVNGIARWRCPSSVVVIPVVDMNMALSQALVWRKDNTSPLLVNFIAEVKRLAGREAIKKAERTKIKALESNG